MTVRLKNRNECPPGGFLVTVPKLNQTRQFWSFSDAVNWFSGLATSNPSLGLPTHPNVIAEFIDQQNALRCLTFNGGDSYVTEKGGPVASAETKKLSLLKPVVAVGAKIKQLVAGAKLFKDWFGEGFKPVERPEAETRAAVCADCPQNGKGDLTRWFTIPASEQLREEIATVKELDLSTTHDEHLGICEACLCPLKLKVHVPLEHIKKHLTPQAKAALDKNCWIK